MSGCELLDFNHMCLLFVGLHANSGTNGNDAVCRQNIDRLKFGSSSKGNNSGVPHNEEEQTAVVVKGYF